MTFIFTELVYFAGAHVIFCMLSLKAANAPHKDLILRNFPKGMSVLERKRSRAVLRADSIHPMITIARKTLIEEIDSRFFQSMPSEARLVQLMMSKQANTNVLPREWIDQGSAFYIAWLRRAADALKLATRVSPHRTAKKRISSNLFDGIGADQHTPQSSSTVAADADATGAGSDIVVNEHRRWSALSQDIITPFVDQKTGMLNEYKLISSQKKEFPLHYFVFRQTCVHISHEANVESTFSLSGSLSHENTHTGFDFLSKATRIQRNKNNHMPSPKAIWEEYLSKFNKEDVGNNAKVDAGMSGGSSSSSAAASDESSGED